MCERLARWVSVWIVLIVIFGTAPMIVRAGESTTEELPKSDPYPLSTCPVSKQKLGSMGEPVVLLHEGRELRFCCQGCVEPFQKEPAKYLEAVDAQIVKEQTPLYPLDKCMVSGEKLGAEHGKAFDLVYRNRLVRFCCGACAADFRAKPGKYLEQLDKAVIEAQLPGYPLDICPISGNKLGTMGEPVNVVRDNRLVRLCCAACEAKLDKAPLEVFAKLDAAARKAPEAGSAAPSPDSHDPSGRTGQ